MFHQNIGLWSTGITPRKQKRQSKVTLPLLTELVGGFPNPPPEGARKEISLKKEVSGVNRLILKNAYYMPKSKCLKLQGYYF
jgi:hypothetical protein